TSRRRHTRSKRDWSSDVCSSDLKMINTYKKALNKAPIIMPDNINDLIGLPLDIAVVSAITMINVIILNNTENTGNQINDNPKTTATPDPKVAPLANPRVKLSANGLFNNVWNIWPASVKPIPANNACTVLGILT